MRRLTPPELPNCPPLVAGQITVFALRVRRILGGNLRGVYLHGSLALGCFNPAGSDIDLLVVTQRPMPVATKRLLAEAVLRTSNAPRPLEISVVHTRQSHPWRHPTPYDFHFSEAWRARLRHELQDGGWRRWNDEERFDGDLAAHFTMTRQRGVWLWGEPIARVIPAVPVADFEDSIVSDLDWARARAAQSPVYGILNHCRVYAYVAEGHIYSKWEGADWAIERVPAEFRALVSSALDAYQGSGAAAFDRANVLAFMNWVSDTITRLREWTLPVRSRSTGS
jgi:predicted nucleotidyltransferase